MSWYVSSVSNLELDLTHDDWQPGAFSAYRYIALQNDKLGVGPLASYFKGEVLHGRDTDIFTSNMCKWTFDCVCKADGDYMRADLAEDVSACSRDAPFLL